MVMHWWHYRIQEEKVTALETLNQLIYFLDERDKKKLFTLVRVQGSLNQFTRSVLEIESRRQRDGDGVLSENDIPVYSKFATVERGMASLHKQLVSQMYIFYFLLQDEE